MTLLLISSTITLSGYSSSLSPRQKNQFRQWMHALTINLFFTNKSGRPIRNAIQNPVINKRWGETNRDCAGFIRYLVWESLNRHDSNWHKNFGSTFTVKLADIQHNIRIPYFTNHNGKQMNFVNARELIEFNSHFISRSSKSAKLKEADILFYKVGQNTYHTMFLFRNYRDGRWLVVYHTGAPKNQLRILALKDLFQHNNHQWHPSRMNPSFLGFFRLNLVR